MTASGSFHCQLAWLGGETASANVLVDVADGLITGVSSGAVAPSHAVRLEGLTLPGLANAHSHAFHRVLRGRTQLGAGSFWTWRAQMYELAERLDPDSYFTLARAVYGEMVLAGITCVGEFHYLHHGAGGRPYDSPNVMGDVLIAAAGEAGLRITLLDTCYLHGGIGVEPNEVQQRFSDGDALSWVTRVSHLEAPPHARVAAAIHSVRAVDPASIEIIAAWAAANEAPLHAHVSEQPAENQQCLGAFGLTPTELLAERGSLGERFTAVHATHLTDVDLDLLGRSNSTVCLCPTTERDLADGIGGGRALLDAGARLSLGSDSHAVIDLFEEARAVELDERLATLARGRHDSVSLLGAATQHGHACLGWNDAGIIAVGARADLVSVRLDSVRTAGTRPEHALDAAVFAASATDVHHVVIDGRVVVSNGSHHTLDVAGELARAVGRW